MRDKETGKSKGFAFLKYEDQRSTVLAVDNLNGGEVLGRKLRVDHTYYKAKEGEEELVEASRAVTESENQSERKGNGHSRRGERESERDREERKGRENLDRERYISNRDTHRDTERRDKDGERERRGSQRTQSGRDVNKKESERDRLIEKSSVNERRRRNDNSRYTDGHDVDKNRERYRERHNEKDRERHRERDHDRNSDKGHGKHREVSDNLSHNSARTSRHSDHSNLPKLKDASNNDSDAILRDPMQHYFASK